VITRSKFARVLFAFGIILSSVLLAKLSAGLPAKESRTPPTTATRQEVWQAVVAELQREGLSEEHLPRIEELDLPGALPLLAGRSLRVSSACWDEGPRRTQFRLECGEPGECLPFLVYLRNGYLHSVYLHNHVGDDQNANARAGSCRPASEPRRALEPSPKPSPKLVVRAGDRATAVFLSNRLRMTASVTCLERGREGEVIRVRSRDGRVFRARISGPARLEALPQQWAMSDER
jgi:hypothetical protein